MLVSDTESAITSLRAGDWVTVRPVADIARSLNDNSCCEGVQFMPNMLPYIGQSFRIRRFANKLCAPTADGAAIYGLDNTVVLDVPRCSGQDHGGCQMGCELLWHTSWLSAGRSSQRFREGTKNLEKKRQLRKQLEQSCTRNPDTVDSKTRYRCQATSVLPKLRPLPPVRLSQYYVDFVQNHNGLSRLYQFARSLVLRKLGVLTDLVGELARTPATDLNLQVGDWVQVKSLSEIQTTLDRKGCNRGLWFDRPAMASYCGRKMFVSRRISRMLNEQNGEMMELQQPAIVLSEAACNGLHRRFCTRGSLLYWREIWLERVAEDTRQA